MLDPSRLLDYFTSIDEKLDRLNRNIERLVEALTALRPTQPQPRSTPAVPPRISVQPPQVFVQVEAPEVQRVLSLPAKVDLLDAWVQSVGTDVTEIQIPPADVLMIASIDDDIWWSPKRFQSVDRGALYLAQNNVLMIPQPGWDRIYVRADSTTTRIVVALFTLVR